MKVWKYDKDDINTDMLFPGKYTYTCSTADEIRPHLLEDLDANFTKEVEPGDVLMAGRNFGCGSSREQPVLGLRSVGIQCVIAKSFARIFYRAAINQGLVLIEAPEAVAAYESGADFALNLDAGEIKIAGKNYRFSPLPAEILAISSAGGLLNYTRQKLEKRSKSK